MGQDEDTEKQILQSRAFSPKGALPLQPRLVVPKTHGIYYEDLGQRLR